MNADCEIFLSFKTLDSNGHPTRDSILAREIFDFLSTRGLTVFLSTISLERLGTDAYKQAIDDALDAARVIVAVGTSRENLDSKWVRYEWDSFLNDVLSGTKPQGRVFAYVEGVALTALPRGLRQTQVFVHGADAMERLYQFLVNSTAIASRQVGTPGTAIEVAPAGVSPAEGRSDRSRNPQARACHERGVASYHHKDYDQAITELSEAIRLDPTVAWAFNDRGSAWLQKGAFAKAIDDFNAGIRLDPSQAWTFHDRGTALFKSGHYVAAMQDYTSALQLDPSLVWSHHDRGACHLQLGQLESAIADFTAAIRLKPEMVWAYRNRAAAYEKLGQPELAQADQAAARLLEPSGDEPLAILYWNRHGQSILMVQTFARDPKWPEAVYHVSQHSGERRPLRCCLKVFGNRVSPVPEETKQSCIANAVENILDLKPDVVGLGGMGSTARNIRIALAGRGFKGKIDYWGGDVGLDAAEFLRRNEVEPPY